MSKRFFLINGLAVFLAGCAAAGSMKPQQAQKVVVRVQAAEPEKVKADKVNEGENVIKSMVVQNQEASLSELSFITKDKAFVKLFSELSVADVTRLWNDLCVLEHNTKIGRLVF